MTHLPWVELHNHYNHYRHMLEEQIKTLLRVYTPGGRSTVLWPSLTLVPLVPGKLRYSQTSGGSHPHTWTLNHTSTHVSMLCESEYYDHLDKVAEDELPALKGGRPYPFIGLLPAPPCPVKYRDMLKLH